MTITFNDWVGSITSGDGDDKFHFGNGANYVETNGGDDEVTAHGWINEISTGDGDDEVHINGTNKADLGAGNDTFSSNNWVESVDGGKGHDHITLNAGGNAHGGEGNDTFVTGPIATNFHGGHGDDTFVFEFTKKNLEQHDVFNGGAGHDTLHIVIDTHEMSDKDISKLMGELSDRHGDFDGRIQSLNIDLTDVENVAITIDGADAFI
jgi:hypothetical protein